MTPEVSPAPSDVPANRDGENTGPGGHEDEIGNGTLEVGVITNIALMDSDPSSEDESDEGEVDDAYRGYTVLEQQPHYGGEDEELSSAMCENMECASYSNMNADVPHQGHSCNETNPASDDTSTASEKSQGEADLHSQQRMLMTDAHAEMVKQAMAGFKLPTPNIPDWAKVVPEDSWKSKLMDSISKKQ